MKIARGAGNLLFPFSCAPYTLTKAVLGGCEMFRSNHVFSAAAVLLLCCGPAMSQTTFATITGRVADQTGAVVPKAVVTATNVATNVSTSGLSNDTGNY